MENKQKLNQALLELQKKVTRVKKTGDNPHFKSKYTPLDEIVLAVRPHMTGLGLILQQHTDVVTVDGKPILELTTRVIHVESGECTGTSVRWPIVDSNPQKLGSLITYLRRYSLEPLLGIVASDDDDGNDAAEVAAKTSAPAKAQAKPAKAQAKPDPLIVDDVAYHYFYDISEVMDSPKGGKALDYITDIAMRGVHVIRKADVVLSAEELKKFAPYEVTADWVANESGILLENLS